MLRIFLIFLLCCHLGCAFKKQPVQEKKNVIESLVVSHPGRNGPLTPLEMKMAKVAWRYFENNYQPNTGFVNSVDGYPSTTMWDTASYLGGLVAAYELGLIDKHEFDKRMHTILETFNKLDFFRGELPNKCYNTQTATKVNYANQPGEIGFSALDLGRLLIWLKIIKERYPEFANAIDHFVMRWNFCHVVDKCGILYGAILKNGQVQYVQEGRLGYEEYSAKGFQLWGFDTSRASMPDPYNFIPIYGVDVPYDTRDPRKTHAHNYVVSESYVLDGIELNWDTGYDTTSDDMTHTDKIIADFAQRIYKVQERRYLVTGILTARTEHQLDGPPYFVYDTIYTDGYPWNTIAETGEYLPQFASVVPKAAIGLWVLWKTPYTDILFRAVSHLYDPDKGFYEGYYEKNGGLIKTFTANNNGIILEELLYKVQGKLLKFRGGESLWDKVIRNPFIGKEKCFPLFQKGCCLSSSAKGSQ
jgi:hypothetical protein